MNLGVKERLKSDCRQDSFVKESDQSNAYDWAKLISLVFVVFYSFFYWANQS